MRDVIIIGSGPAGLSAAIYAMRAGFSALVIEKAPMSGGQIINTYEVDNYPGLPGINGFDLAEKFRQHAAYMEAEFVEDEVEALRLEGRVKEVVTKKNVYQAKAVIIGAGATHAHLGVSGEEELCGVGVSYCATCDGAFFRNKVTAVIGGGDVAAEDAVFLARGCEKVYLIHRRDRLRAAARLQKRLEEFPNVEILWDTTVNRICGQEQVEGLELHNRKTGEDRKISVDGVFIAVGIRPASAPFTEVLAADEKGYLIAGEDCCTNIPGVFAVGDIRTKALRQVVTAAADGANAVASVEKYMLEFS